MSRKILVAISGKIVILIIIMPRKNDEILRGLIGDIGTMIDARNKTLEINIKGHVDKAIKDSEERIRKDMATKEDLRRTEEGIRGDMATKEDLRRLEERMATKDDINRLEQKIDKTTELQHQLDELKGRVKVIEENVRVHN